MAETLSLPRIERWMQAVLVHPKSAAAGVVSRKAAREIPADRIGRVIREGGRLTPVERLGVYQEMYLLRMRDALAADYPVLAQILGEHSFFRLVTDYVQVHPSKSYTLNRLGERLPQFIERYAPFARRRMLVDLARLELAMTEVFDETEAASLDSAAIARVPADRWESARLVPIPALRLLELETPADLAFTAVRNGRPLPSSRRSARRLVIFRRDLAVRFRVLDAAGFALLGQLARGVALGRAVSNAAATSRLSTAAVERHFRDWIAEGFFAGITLSPKTIKPKRGRK